MKLLTFALGLVIICGPVLAQPHYTGVYGNSPHCQGCHAQAIPPLNQYSPWLSSPHAGAYDGLPTAAKSNPICLPCHTTGWDLTLNNGGFDDYFYTGDSAGMAEMRNVQCESCHGPTSQIPHPATTVINYHAELCGGCHTGMGRLTFDQWQMGGHSTIAPAPAQNLACAKCHEAASAATYVRTGVPPVTLPASPVWQVTCVACHATHSTPVSEHQVYLPADSTCRVCHNKNGAVVGQVPHSPQKEMLLGPGNGGYEWPGYQYNNSCHQTYVPQPCVLCHMYSNGLGNPDTTATGHALTPNIQVCVVCHNGQIPPDSSFNINGAQTVIDGLLDSLAVMLAQADTTTLEYQRAKYDYDFVNNDKSRGVHNFMYAEDLLMSSIMHLMPINVDVTLTAINPPIVIPAQGGSFQFNAAVVNHSSTQSPFSVWARMRYPNGTWSGLTLGPVSINPPLNQTVSRQRTQNIPGSYPPGLYYYVGYAACSYPGTIADSSYFTFTKSSTATGGPWITDAACTGEPFPGESSQTVSIPSGLDLGVWPNPFNPTTTIRYRLTSSLVAQLTVHDVQGRLVATLVDGQQEAGQYSVTFDGSRLASGIYLYTLTVGQEHATGKMMLLK